MVRLHDRHCSGSSIMPQKRNPDTLEVIKAKASFAQGILTSFLSVGKALFVGYNRDTQWTKYWIMDLIEETLPALSVMADIIRLLEVDRGQMAKEARREFIGTTALMEWLVQSFGIPLRKAKMITEKAVRYSEEEGAEEVTSGSLNQALREMGIDISVKAQSVKEAQQPEGILTRTDSIGMPSEKRVKEHLVFLRKQIGEDRKWLSREKKEMEKAKDLVLKMEKELLRHERGSSVVRLGRSGQKESNERRREYGKV